MQLYYCFVDFQIWFVSIRVTQFLFLPWSKLYEVFASMYSFLYLYLYLYVYLYLCPFLFLGRCVQGASPRVWEVSRASASGQPRWKAGVQNGSLAIGRWFKDNPLEKDNLGQHVYCGEFLEGWMLKAGNTSYKWQQSTDTSDNHFQRHRSPSGPWLLGL